ncbi:MAG TPA: hypothetical protein VJM14_11665 [Burkholderiales bacterium]|nr:hypothetical protein [Burkholderiales bacterium]
MKKRNANVLLHLASPPAGNEVREVLRELATLAGVERIAPSAKVARLLMIDYDPEVIAAATLVGHARRRWAAAQLVGM